jgi:DNA polymerase-3 subunit delta
MPRLGVAHLLERLAKGKLLPGILLVGSDLYLRDTCREKIIEAYIPETARAWGVTRLSLRETPLDRVFRQAQTSPMLSPRQVVVVADLEVLERLGDDARDAVLRQFEQYFADPAPFTVLVLEAAALDQRMKLFKSLREQVLVVEAEICQDPAERQTTAVALTLRMARDAGVEMDRDAAGELSEMLNAQPALIHAEVQKLATYVGERKRVTVADVEALVVSEKSYTIWELTDLLATRQRDRALVFLDTLVRAGEAPPMIVGALAWMYRKLIEAQELPPGPQSVRKLGIRPATAELALRQSRRIPRQQLLDGLQALYEADNLLKSAGADDRAILEFLVAKLTAPALDSKSA